MLFYFDCFVFSVTARDLVIQQRFYDKKVKQLMEKRPQFAHSVATQSDPDMPQKKFTYSKQFKSVHLRLLLVNQTQPFVACMLIEYEF